MSANVAVATSPGRVKSCTGTMIAAAIRLSAETVPLAIFKNECIVLVPVAVLSELVPTIR